MKYGVLRKTSRHSSDQGIPIKRLIKYFYLTESRMTESDQNPQVAIFSSIISRVFSLARFVERSVIQKLNAQKFRMGKKSSLWRNSPHDWHGWLGKMQCAFSLRSSKGINGLAFADGRKWFTKSLIGSGFKSCIAPNSKYTKYQQSGHRRCCVQLSWSIFDILVLRSWLFQDVYVWNKLHEFL